ncbi:MAG: DUF4338 domain-containing protein, partial [Actinomycetota bacterium]|nr:DUF4338 domain-containing protein [Actinomycetota bacterium]
MDGSGLAMVSLRCRRRSAATGAILVQEARHAPTGGVELYARVPSHEQQFNLDRQVARVADWAANSTMPVALVETFVEVGRQRGACCQAPNWIRVGRTKGRGKLDHYNNYALPVKDIYLYPLVRNFQRQLTAPPGPSRHLEGTPNPVAGAYFTEYVLRNGLLASKSSVQRDALARGGTLCFACVVTGPRERGSLNVSEAHIHADTSEFIQFLRPPPASHWKMLCGRSQVLAQGHDLYPNSPQV